MIEQSFFDVGKYGGNVERLRPDLVTLVSELAKGAEYHERIVPYLLEFNRDGVPSNFELDWSSFYSSLESQAVINIFEMAQKGAEKLVWISSPTEIHPEARIVLMKRKENENVCFDCVAICGDQSKERCREIAKSLGTEVDDAYELKAMPIVITDWREIFDLLNMPKVEDIVRRQDYHIFYDRSRRLEGVYGLIEKMAGNVDRSNEYDVIRRGAEIEQVLAEVGLGLSSTGSCGKSNSELLSGMNVAGPFDRIFIGSPKFSILSSEESYFECPKCKGKIPSGKGITTCPYCGMKKEDCRIQCG